MVNRREQYRDVEIVHMVPMGIGSIPDAVLLFLHEKKNLGRHSELLSDGIVDLLKGGVNNSKKTLYLGKSIATFLMGTRKHVDYIVTKFGIARMTGQSLRQRVKALIGIAHPKFRMELTEAYAKKFSHQLEEE